MFTNQNNYQNHAYFMNLALNQARRSLGSTKENPSVGCIIVKNNNVISAGSTGLNGRPHAEQSAIKLFKKKFKGSKLYVTLEPCSNYGMTPPCVKLIIKNKIKKVFFSIKDPDIRSYNKSSSQFRMNDIKVSKGILNKEINFFYRSYIKFKRENLPFVTCKLAVSKDFFTIDKKKGWITNEYSRGRVHLMRHFHDCILTSSRTVNTDNPRLTCRINGLNHKSPSRIILDRKLSIRLNSEVIRDSAHYKTIIFYNKKNIKKIDLLRKLKINTYKIPLNDEGNLDLKISLIKAKELGFSRIFLESGIKLTTSFLNNNFVDDFKLFISNSKLGKNGAGNIKKYFRLFLKNKKNKIEKVNLFGEKLISYKIK